MTREDLRDFIRILADELTEAPKGLFLDTQLNILLNVSQRTLQLKLITMMPWYFRQSQAFDWGTSETYAITTDVGISDLFIFEGVFHNLSNQKPTPLYYCESPEDKYEYMTIGNTGSVPKAWGYEDRDNIFVLPLASAAVTDRLKAYYFKRIPDLNHDTSDTSPNVATPHIDEALHHLIGYEVLFDWFIRDKAGSDYTRMRERAGAAFDTAMLALTMPQGFSTGRLPGAEEYLDFSLLSSNVNP